MFTFHRFFLLLLLALAFWVDIVLSSPSSSSPSLRDTNARRLARGLPPIPPRLKKHVRDQDYPPSPLLSMEFSWFLVFTRVIDASRLVIRVSSTPGAKRSATSPLPPVQVAGRLQVRPRSGGSSLGNVRNWSGGAPISGVNFLGADQDLLVTLTNDPSDPTRVDVLATNAAFPAPHWVGASTFSSQAGLATGSPSTVAFTNVAQTPPGSPPVPFPARNVYDESAIWTFNPSTNQLIPQWINPDGSSPLTELAYNIRNNVLFFVGDINAYNAANTFPASVVDLFLVV